MFFFTKLSNTNLSKESQGCMFREFESGERIVLDAVFGQKMECISKKTDNPDLANVPQCYWDLKQVCSKFQDSLLPPHRPYDCAIDHLPLCF